MTKKISSIILISGLILCIFLLSAGCQSKSEQAESKAEGKKSSTATAREESIGKTVRPAQVRANHILISHAGVPRIDASRSKEEAEKLAKDLLGKLQAGESFEALAGEYSDCPSSAKGGDLGAFGKGQMVKPFEETAFALEVGKISGIVETQFGYHIIKRTQ